MKTERGYVSHHYMDDGYVSRLTNESVFGLGKISTSSSSSSNSAPPSPGGLNNYIEHRVTKMDTLAGVAIKYGVEVADIRRMNGLVSEVQMFAHKSLQIPLPGRHPPSPVLPNETSAYGEQTPPRRPHEDILDSFQSLKLKAPRTTSPGINTLYGSATHKTGQVLEGTEMSVYKTGRVLCMEDGLLPKESPVPDSVFSRQRRSRSLVSLENGDIATVIAETGDESESDRPIRRRQQVEVDTPVRTPEIGQKEDSMRTAKPPAPRPKFGSRTDMEVTRQNNIPFIDSLLADVFVSIRKSSSTSNLQELVNASSSLWNSGKWSNAFSRPFGDALPNPVSARRNKAALD